MRLFCLRNHQLEALAHQPERARPRWRAHANRCPHCRARLEQALRDHELVKDIRELNETDQQLASLRQAAATALQHRAGNG